MKVTATWTGAGFNVDTVNGVPQGTHTFTGTDELKRQLPEVNWDALMKNFFIDQVIIHFKYDGEVRIQVLDN